MWKLTRRDLLKNSSAAALGAFALGDPPKAAPAFESRFIYSNSIGDATREGAPIPPIELSLLKAKKNATCSVKMKSGLTPSGPELVLNMESCIIAVLPKADSEPPPPHTAQLAFHAQGPLAISVPFCNVQNVEEKRLQDGLELTLNGMFDKLAELPFVLKLRLTTSRYSVRIVGEMVSLPREVKLMALCPDLVCQEFRAENHPPFEMARQSFTFLEGKGFCWLSDIQRRESEIHGQEGPWIQTVGTKQFAQDRINVLLRASNEALYGWPFKAAEDVAASPLAGWVARDKAYMIATAGKNAYEIGTRWGPCLHSDMAAEPGSNGSYLPFEARVYILPVDLERLLRAYREDFGDGRNPSLFLPKDALWPYSQGTLLGNFEGEELATWKAIGGKLTAYGSNDLLPDGRRRLWVANGLKKPLYPEGITEGNGSALWEVPAGGGEATLSRMLRLPEPVTHFGLDAMNRSENAVEIGVTLSEGRKRKGNKAFLLPPSSNRRLLVALWRKADREEVTLVLSMKDRREPARVVLDNLRGFGVT
jgi:hypothetical protein